MNHTVNCCIKDTIKHTNKRLRVSLIVSLIQQLTVRFINRMHMQKNKKSEIENYFITYQPFEFPQKT